MIHGHSGSGTPFGHIRFHRHQCRPARRRGYSLTQHAPIRRKQQDSLCASRRLPLQQMRLLGGAVVRGGRQEAQFHIQILRRLLHAPSHGGNCAVSVAKDDRHLQQSGLILPFAGSKGQQPEEYAQSDQGKHQLE